METREFLVKHYPYYDMDHSERCFFCDGKAITNKMGTENKEPCQYYKFKGFNKSGCNHPKRG